MKITFSLLVRMQFILLVVFSLFRGVSFADDVYSKPPLYDTALPYIKYFQDNVFDSASIFPGFSKSYYHYLGGGTREDENVIENGAISYDQTILARIQLARGITEVVDTFVLYMKNKFDMNNPVINANHAYYDGDNLSIDYGPYRLIRATGRDVSGWWNTWDWTLDTGSAACIITASLDAYSRTANADYLDLAKLFAGYLLQLQDSDGGLRYGPRGMYHANGLDFFWNLKSTEQNERAYCALRHLYEITKVASYKTASDALIVWLKSMYDKDVHLFYSAATFNGAGWNKSDFGYVATDVMAFAPLESMFTDSYFGATQIARDAEVKKMFEEIEKRTAFKDANGLPVFFKFSVSQSGDYGSVEWSSQMALAYLKASQILFARHDRVATEYYLKRYTAIVGNLEKYFSIPVDNALAKVAPYASYLDGRVAGNVPTGTGYLTFNCQAALASAYFGFAKAGFDPSEPDGGPGIPVLDDTTPPSKPVVVDEGVTTVKSDQLYASWSSEDKESGIVEYQYRILRDSISGVVVRNWTSTGTIAYVTAGGLSLENGKKYFFAVQAKNGAGLWSTAGNSDGITVQLNHDPVITSTPVTAAVVGKSYQYDVNASDQDGDTLVYALTEKPSGMVIQTATGLITWTPQVAHVGSVPVTIKVSDSKGGSATQRYSIVVTSVGDTTKPVLEITAPRANTFVSCEGFSFEGTANDDKGIADVRVYVYDYGRQTQTVNNAVATYNATSKKWSFQINASHMTPGYRMQLWVGVTDTSGNHSGWKSIFFFANTTGSDVTAPSVEISSPKSGAVVSYKGFVLSGTANDASGISKVYIYVYDYGRGTSTVIDSLASYDASSKVWKFNVSKSHVSKGYRAQIWVSAVDKKGNQSDGKSIIVVAL